MTLHNHAEQLPLISEALESHARRLETLCQELLGDELSDRKETGYPDGPSPKPSTLMGQLETGTFDLRRQVERIGAATSRLESVIADPRNTVAAEKSASTRY